MHLPAQALHKFISTALVILFALPAGATCTNLTSALEGLIDVDFLKLGATHEAGILAGEPPAELGLARRERKKQLKEQPELAKGLAARLGQPTAPASHTAGEILFGLDLLTQTDPKLFVDAASGMLNGRGSTAPLSPALRNQLSSRMISSLALTKPADSIRLFEALAKNPWARQYLAADNNAPRSMLSAMKQIAEAAKTDPALAAKLPAVKTIVNDWIQPRAQRAIKGQLSTEAHGFDDKMDWAFSRVLAGELGQTLKGTDPAGALHFEKLARDLAHVRNADEFAKYPRAQELLESHGMTEGH